MSNAYDAQTAWQTRNALPGPFNLQIVQANQSQNASGSGTGTVRAGWTPPTPETNSSHAGNSSKPANFGTQTLPHAFDLLGTENGNKAIPSGVYYRLVPIMDKASQHPTVPNPIWFPVTGDNPVDFTFSHQWDQADNLAKKFLGSIATNIGGDAGDLAFKQAQHLAGGGIYGSGCSVFNSSAPPTISIATKLFAIGTGSLISIIEKLRFDTHARRGGGGLAANIGAAVNRIIPGAGGSVSQALNTAEAEIAQLAAAAGGKAGSIDHPGWWDVEVISFAGDGSRGVVASLTDMVCTGLKVTMYSPWIGLEPSYMELRIDFQHAYPGLAESAAFGHSISKQK